MAAPKAGKRGFARGVAKALKGQPWILYDTVASASYIPGDKTTLAIGTQGPAITADGKMVFFNAGRTKAGTGPSYTNVDAAGLMSYGFEVWAIYCMVIMPSSSLLNTTPAAGPPVISSAMQANPEVLACTRVAEAIINGGVLSVDLGQESQVEFPVHRFGAGGGIQVDGLQLNLPHNGATHRSHTMVLPEPVQMPRTQNLTAMIRLSPEALATLGTVAAPAFGAPLAVDAYDPPGAAASVDVPKMPFMTQIGLVGKRIKKVQYGQTG